MGTYFCDSNKFYIMGQYFSGDSFPYEHRLIVSRFGFYWRRFAISWKYRKSCDNCLVWDNSKYRFQAESERYKYNKME